MRLRPDRCNLLKYVHLDLKNQATMNVSELPPEFANMDSGDEKLSMGLFGTITTESGLKNFKVWCGVTTTVTVTVTVVFGDDDDYD